MNLDKPFRAGRAAVVLEFSGAADAKRLFDVDEFTFAD